MIVTNEMIWRELQEQKKLLNKLIYDHETYSIEEISLNKAAKLLRLGPATVINLVKRGKLNARTYRDSNRKTRYRFRLADIKEFQQTEKFVPGEVETIELESSEDLARRIFNRKTI